LHHETKTNLDMKTEELKQQLDRIESCLSNQKEVLTFEEAARYAGVSKSHLYKLTSGGKIPYYKPAGKMCYFNRTELDAWLQQNRVSTQSEIESRAQALCMSGAKRRGGRA
jgi:excisionase family DNA binding protein